MKQKSQIFGVYGDLSIFSPCILTLYITPLKVRKCWLSKASRLKTFSSEDRVLPFPLHLIINHCLTAGQAAMLVQRFQAPEMNLSTHVKSVLFKWPNIQICLKGFLQHITSSICLDP